MWDVKQTAYQLQPVCVWVFLDILVNIAVYHPLRNHCKVSLRHCHSYQRQNVGMLQSFPRDNFLAEPLPRTSSVLKWEEWGMIDNSRQVFSASRYLSTSA